MKKILTCSILVICTGFLLFTACKKDDVTPTGSNGSSSSSSSNSSSSSVDDPKIGSYSFASNLYEMHKNEDFYIAVNGTAGGSFTTTSISGTTTLAGFLEFELKSSGGTLTAGDYTIVTFSSNEPAPGTAVLEGYSSVNGSNYTFFYATSGKLTVSISGGITTVSFTDLPVNTKEDGSGADLGKVSGSVTP